MPHELSIALTLTPRQIAEATGLNYYTLLSRLRRGWSPERAITEETRHDAPGPLKHGMTGTKEYKAWTNMKRRCSDPTTHNWHRYGGRGIKVCAEWTSSFESFYDHLGPAPSSAHSIGRIDNDADYEPGNVEWQTAKQQANNRGSNQPKESSELL
jgi:hypothetical protein